MDECNGPVCDDFEHREGCSLYDEDAPECGCNRCQLVEMTPRCDLCDYPESCGADDCTICPGNWDGETGRHLDCIGWL